MIPADSVVWAKWRNDERTGLAQTIILKWRDRSQAEGQYTHADGAPRLRLFLDKADAGYRLTHARENCIARGYGRSETRALTHGEFREIATAMFGGRLRRRPYVGWVLDLEPVPSEAGV